MVAAASLSESFGSTPTAPALAARLTQVAFAFPTGASILEDVHLSVGRGELLCILGPSGSGKSTILNLLAGLLTPLRGEVAAGGRAVTGPSSERAVVFQDSGLFPWMNLLDNVSYPLRTKGVAKAVRSRRANELLHLVGLDDHASKFPHELSGGMRQRGAIARALAAEPALLLMDEPFSALDLETRARLQEKLLQIHASRRLAVLFVTHNVEEAVALGDRVVVVAGRPGTVVHQRIIDVPRPRRASDPSVLSIARELGAVVAASAPREALEVARAS